MAFTVSFNRNIMFFMLGSLMFFSGGGGILFISSNRLLCSKYSLNIEFICKPSFSIKTSAKYQLWINDLKILKTLTFRSRLLYFI